MDGRRGTTTKLEPRSSSPRLFRMVETHETEIVKALRDRDTRVAALIVEGLRSILDLIDEQPPEILEPLLEHVKELQLLGSSAPAHRYTIRSDLFRYVEAALAVARDRERRKWRVFRS
ncbi:MAG: hypothetical protein J2P54_01075 [Bradyrhizobiaceae bacterium]|nr:hypothetical protein [Bradyrhizobiaceae bacterium]